MIELGYLIMENAVLQTKALKELGFSNLVIAIKTLKIDRSFIIDMTTDHNNRVITQAIILMAKSLNLSTVAEGVETLEHVNMLKEMGCD